MPTINSITPGKYFFTPKKAVTTIIVAIMAYSILTLSGCSEKTDVKLDPKKPVTITVWHYYNGAQKTALDKMIDDFNHTVGLEKGIIIEGHNQGDINQLEQSIQDSIAKEVGSKDLPNIFASYADTAFAVENQGLLADLDNYFSPEEQAQYVPSYIEEGRIGQNGELKIFPTAKSTEIFMMNKTDWDIFSAETRSSLEELATMEGLADVSEKFYHWTDSKTPDVLNDGKAFFGRDAMANLFIIGSKQLGVEIFQVQNQQLTMNIDENVMRKIWDYYYIPYIRGYFGSFGRFRSDDAKVGEIIALVGSTSSASYFPSQVTKGDETYPIETLVLPAPVFQNGQKYAVQQGAGMAVTCSTPEKEFASVLFLKWFTQQKRNLEFSYSSGYLPVRTDANDFSLLQETIQESGIPLSSKMQQTLTMAYDLVKTHELYTNKAFDSGSSARKILEYHLQDKAVADRNTVLQELEKGKDLDSAVAPFETDEAFKKWFQAFKTDLTNCVK